MTASRVVSSLLCIILTVTAACGVAYSQMDQAGQGQGAARATTTNFHYAEPNELTIIVSALGAVRAPGRYEISRKIDLLNFLALAGGPVEGADLGDVRIYRTVELNGRTERKEIRVNLKDLSRFQGEPFELQEGDLLYVSRSEPVTFQEVMSYISTVAVTTLAIITIVRVTGPGGGYLR